MENLHRGLLCLQLMKRSLHIVRGLLTKGGHPDVADLAKIVRLVCNFTQRNPLAQLGGDRIVNDPLALQWDVSQLRVVR